MDSSEKEMYLTPDEPAGHRTRRDSNVSDDSNVQATNDDASECKYSAVKLGYWQDVHLRYLVRKAERKSPEIHRGYFARVRAVRQIVDRFLSIFAGKTKKCQVISLGAGFDTLFWQLNEAAQKGGPNLPDSFVEVDFSTITAKKIHHIQKPSSPLRTSVAGAGDVELREVSHKNLYGPVYRLVGADIRDVQELNTQLHEAGVDFEKPTLFIAECVLVYMTVAQSNHLLAYLSERFPQSYFLNYDPTNLNDKFGEIFKENMHARGLLLAGVEACDRIESQIQRFQRNGWPVVDAWSMRIIYSNLLPKDQIARIESIEPLDEKELLDQLLDHYCCLVAKRDSSLPALNFD